MPTLPELGGLHLQIPTAPPSANSLDGWTYSSSSAYESNQENQNPFPPGFEVDASGVSASPNLYALPFLPESGVDLAATSFADGSISNYYHAAPAVTTAGTNCYESHNPYISPPDDSTHYWPQFAPSYTGDPGFGGAFSDMPEHPA